MAMMHLPPYEKKLWEKDSELLMAVLTSVRVGESIHLRKRIHSHPQDIKSDTQPMNWRAHLVLKNVGFSVSLKPHSISGWQLSIKQTEMPFLTGWKQSSLLPRKHPQAARVTFGDNRKTSKADQ
ncbi:Hypothetical predicted protein [Lynx pardinus]|uniref:Uncharacterized protein n=1 Tax=Lynx pardinus TaxID=191816 RepID=A0A485P7N7_LYNPA|nr:Hypothetical predicted protein [Lynx pardinus]